MDSVLATSTQGPSYTPLCPMIQFNSAVEVFWAHWCCCSLKVVWKFPQGGTPCPSTLMNLARPCCLKHHALLHWLPAQGFNQEESLIRL
ncbi:hypothetical protein AMELA_G00111240 [Ameiurus melas]|uniref:Uncharacterized protein n=1 Tax=Ameiurus melas TaxID=219545 RepID=A0A7J6ASA1_AMEME|nr:hypothetical protein AMELA_G00111240 [Ameiurus melas]